LIILNTINFHLFVDMQTILIMTLHHFRSTFWKTSWYSYTTIFL